MPTLEAGELRPSRLICLSGSESLSSWPEDSTCDFRRALH